MDVLDAFAELSLDECLDAQSAVQELTRRLDEIGHEDYKVELTPSLAYPAARKSEYHAHAKAGCVFYTFSGGEGDRTHVYYLHDSSQPWGSPVATLAPGA